MDTLTHRHTCNDAQVFTLTQCRMDTFIAYTPTYITRHNDTLACTRTLTHRNTHANTQAYTL